MVHVASSSAPRFGMRTGDQQKHYHASNKGISEASNARVTAGDSLGDVPC
jgi:hypothetical protein